MVELFKTDFFVKNYHLNFFQVLQSSLLKTEKNFLKKMLDIARARRKTLKKKKETRKIRKIQAKATDFLKNFTSSYRKTYILLGKKFGKTYYIATFLLQFFHVVGYWK